MVIVWKALSLKKKNLDKFLRKHLMKWVLKKNIRLFLTEGASLVLRERRNELSQTTLKLIVLFNQASLIEIVVPILPLPLLQQLAASDEYSLLCDLPDATFEKLIPIILEHQKELFCHVSRRILRIGNVEENIKKYKNDKRFAEAILERDDCPLPLFLELVRKYPAIVNESFGIGERVLRNIANGSLELVSANINSKENKDKIMENMRQIENQIY